MKILGIDRVTILVKDMDRAKEFLSKVFEMEFHEGKETGGKEGPGTKLSEIGIRGGVTLPNVEIELLSVVDPIKATEAATKIPLLKDVLMEMVELDKKGYEGPFSLWLKVEDGEEAAADAKRKGIRVAGYREGEHPGIVPPFKEVFLNSEDMVIKGINLMSKHPR